MIYNTLDQITRINLLENGLPLHFYMERLVHGASCFRELNFDTLGLVNTVKLPINDYYAIDLPDDFVDDVALGFRSNDRVINIPHQPNIIPLRNRDTDGSYIPYVELTGGTDEVSFFGFNSGWTFFWNVNDFGEPTGRYFGSGGGTPLGYQVVRERRQIQLTQNTAETECVLQYISDGQSADSATQVDVRAIATVNAYQNWKASPNAAIKDSPEANTFYNERRKLVARLSDLTVIDIKQVLRSAYHATIKN